MSAGITIGNDFIKWEDLKSFKSTTPQQQAAIDFIISWKSGLKNFHLTTSGSTGNPRPIIISREKMEYSARATLSHFHLKNSDHAVICMNMSFVAGIMMAVRAIIADMEITILEPSATPELDNPAYTFTAIAPLQLQNLINSGADLSKYRCILVGGAPVANKLREELKLQPENIYETYGMTETVSHFAVRKISGSHPDEVFKCIQEIELATDENECLKIKGHITDHVWLQTNDRVELVGNDSFKWLGRADWIINSGGIKLQPETIEAKITRLMAEIGIVNDLVVTGYPHPTLGECAILVIEGNSGTTVDEILIHLKKNMNKYEIPKQIVEISAFPRTQTGKINRPGIRPLLPPLTF